VDGLGGLRLPTFWVDKPASWFITAESWFRLYGINREQTRYDFLVAALSKEAVSLVLDIVESPPGHHPYTALKERLLESHQLKDYQRVSLLLRMEPLGGRKPSELLAAMLELCPRGHETSIFFTHLFLERLQAELRIMLGEDNHQNPRDVAKKADSLWALHKMHLTPGAVVASVDGSSSVDGLFSSHSAASTAASAVPAVSSRGVGRGGRVTGRGGRGGRGGRSSASARCGSQPLAGDQLSAGLPQAAPPLSAGGPGEDPARLVFLPLQFRRAGPQQRRPLQLGKLAFRGLVGAVAPGQLVHITDQLSQGVSWWIPELPIRFFLISQPALQAAQPWLVQLGSQFPVGETRFFTSLLEVGSSAGLFCWLQYSSALLE
jgi:hypothetical protein